MKKQKLKLTSSSSFFYSTEWNRKLEGASEVFGKNENLMGQGVFRWTDYTPHYHDDEDDDAGFEKYLGHFRSYRWEDDLNKVIRWASTTEWCSICWKISKFELKFGNELEISAVMVNRKLVTSWIFICVPPDYLKIVRPFLHASMLVIYE